MEVQRSLAAFGCMTDCSLRSLLKARLTTGSTTDLLVKLLQQPHKWEFGMPFPSLTRHQVAGVCQRLSLCGGQVRDRLREMHCGRVGLNLVSRLRIVLLLR